jgi:hypothetical protein
MILFNSNYQNKNGVSFQANINDLPLLKRQRRAESFDHRQNIIICNKESPFKPLIKNENNEITKSPDTLLRLKAASSF